MACCVPLSYFPALWLKWHVSREVRDIYETAKNGKEVEQRLRDLVDYMKWKSQETLAAYEHYFGEQRNADKREGYMGITNLIASWLGFLPAEQQERYRPILFPTLHPFLAEEFSKLGKEWESQQQEHRKAETEAVVPQC
jgi:hypothetical protein